MAELSPRQLELARLVADGYTNAEIASKLQLSRQTVKNHVRAAYEKLGVHNRVLLSLKMTKGTAPKNRQPDFDRALEPPKSQSQMTTSNEARKYES
jgi:DNA-binding CsgD family transcriptional regulator